jgi:hypothetical protein
MPAFVPGHGEIVLVFPNSSLYFVPYTPPKVIALIFTQIYAGIFIGVFFLFKWLPVTKSRG